MWKVLYKNINLKKDIYNLLIDQKCCLKFYILVKMIYEKLLKS